MLNGRIYRTAFLPLLFALVIAGFSLTVRTPPLTSGLAPEAFEGARAFAELESLARQFPQRRPGGPGDRRLAAYVARTLRGLGGAARGGFSLSVRSVRARTIDGERTLTTVIAQRPGTTGGEPIVIVAHRDAAGRGARAELSGTAVLLELARVLAASSTQRAIVLVSTSGGSGGNAGAADFAAHAGELLGEEGEGGGEGGAGRSIDATLVLGDLAGQQVRGPLVEPFSASAGSAPALLQSTVESAIDRQAGLAASAPGTLAQLAHLVFALPGGEQAPFGARGQPAVLVGVSGEQPPPADEPVSAARLEGLGRAVLSAVYALDDGPESNGSASNEIQPTSEAGLQIQHKAIPEWALRLLVATLLLPPLLALGDGFARLRRQRGLAAERSIGRWVLWTLACALPFLACALFAILLGGIGAIPAPMPPVSPAALPLDARALEAVLASTLVLVLAWLGWPALMRALGLPVRPRGDAASLALLLVLGGVAVVVWVLDPLTALLLAPALNLWLVFVSPAWIAGARGVGAARIQALALVALGVVPLALLVAFYAAQLDLGPGGVAHTALLLLAGGRIGVGGVVLWSVAFGCLAGMLLLALAPAPPGDPRIGGPDEGFGEREAITVRGPLSYAGPGSLGGTESALRR